MIAGSKMVWAVETMDVLQIPQIQCYPHSKLRGFVQHHVQVIMVYYIKYLSFSFGQTLGLIW